MDKPTFKIDLDDETPVKPLPYKVGRRSCLGRVTIPNYYHKYELEFYETVKDCARYIDTIKDTSERLKFHVRLSKLFITRDKVAVMRLFRVLINNANKGA